MSLRICALSVPAFMHGGLEVNERWSAFPADATERQLAALRDYHGRFIRIHPDDRGEVEKLGLAFVDEHSPLTDMKKRGGETAPIEPKPDAPKPEPTKKKTKTDA